MTPLPPELMNGHVANENFLGYGDLEILTEEGRSMLRLENRSRCGGPLELERSFSGKGK